MWFAILSAVVGLACVTVCIRVLGAVPDSQSIEVTLTALRRGQLGPAATDSDDLLDPARLVSRVQGAGSRERAVAELNEFVTEVSRQLTTGARVPGALARTALASGALFAVLALADALRWGASAEMVTPVVVSLVAGLAAGFVCLQIGRVASRRRRALREAAEGLRRQLERQLLAAREKAAPGGFADT